MQGIDIPFIVEIKEAPADISRDQIAKIIEVVQVLYRLTLGRSLNPDNLLSWRVYRARIHRQEYVSAHSLRPLSI
jgi:hypothetical protein